MPKPFFTPWKRPGFDGTLIIAESCPKGDQTNSITGYDYPNKDWPIKFILSHVIEKCKQDDYTFKRLRQSFLYGGAVLDAEEFWERHAFTNLVPRLVGGTAPKTLTAEDWRRAREQFPLILESVRPKRILIASDWVRKVLKGMSDGGCCVRIGLKDGWEMRLQGVPTVGIYHPSAWNRVKPPYTIKQARRVTKRLWRISQGV